MIESDLTRIAVALESIAKSLSEGAKHTPVALQAPAVVAPTLAAPVVTPVAPVAAPAAAMPAAPFPITAPVAPVVAPVVTPAPVATAVFASKQEMTDFVIAKYRALGAEKGALIQGVLTTMGYANINDVDPARWGELKAGIEAL
jgi:hypothetical protein